MDSARSRPGRPASDVSPGTGLAGLLGLIGWIVLCRNYGAVADAIGLPGPHRVLSGPYAALLALVFSAAPMIAWSVLVDKVHRRPSTGIDWRLRRPLAERIDISIVKLAGLWATWALLAALYCLARWYWDGQYLFAMHVLGVAVIPLVVLCVPYILWLDGRLVDPRDHCWHFGALLLGRAGWDMREVKRHGRAWIVKGFFGAFMLSILPGGFAAIVEGGLAANARDPAGFATMLVQFLFVVDVQIGTVGYLLTFRPLDSHIRSGNPLLAGWLAALLCYPPFALGLLGNGAIIGYEYNTPGWQYWTAGHPALAWGWGALLVGLTGIYAWATVAFGIRFSNLTYRGVLTNGPYRFTRHPAYLAKNGFWWCSTLPFLVNGDGSIVDVVRNTFFLGVVSAIYYWRARTEEAHLLAEDAKYREYHAWMARHGAITAPLERLRRRIVGLRTPG